MVHVAAGLTPCATGPSGPTPTPNPRTSRGARTPLEAMVDDALEQGLVRDAPVLGRLGEVLAVGQLRVWIGLEYVDASIGVHPQVDARVA